MIGDVYHWVVLPRRRKLPFWRSVVCACQGHQWWRPDLKYLRECYIHHCRRCGREAYPVRILER